MGKAMDFNKLRKRRQRTQTFKRLLILAAVMAAIVGVFVLNNLLIEGGVTTRISDLIESFGGSGYPVPLPGGIIRDIKSAGDDLAVLNDTNLYIYNSKGKTVANIQEMSDTTIMQANASRVLAFDVGKKQFSVHSLSKQLVSQKLEYGIINGTMNDRGDYAIVSSSKQYVAETTVYNRKHMKIYQCFSADNLVLDVALSPGGDMMALACLNAQDGVLKTIVYLYRLDSDKQEAEATLELPDNLVLTLQFPEKDRITMLTDRQYLVLDSQCAVKSSYQLGEKQVVAWETRGREVLLLSDYDDERARDLVLLDAACNEKMTFTAGEKVLDMALGKDRIYLHTESGIQSYNARMEPRSTLEQRGISQIHLVGSRLYYLTPEEINVLGAQKKEASDTEGMEEEASQ